MTRHANDDLQELVTINWSRQFGKFQRGCSHAENADGGTQANHLLIAPARFVVEAVRYVNPTGLAVDPTNYGVLTVKNGANVVATWSTLTGQEGTLGAGTVVTMTLGTAANLIVEAGETLTFNADETGTTTIPAGEVELLGRYVPDDVEFAIFVAKRKMHVDRVDLKLLSGITEDASNYYEFELLNDATVVASWSTEDGVDGTLTADTFATLTADGVLEAGDVLSLSCAETGEAVLSDIELVIHGRYVD